MQGGSGLRESYGETGYLVVGRAGMDLAPEPAGTGIEEARQFSASLGGSAANVAVGLSRLGRRAGLLSAVSADPVGDYCINELRRYGVSTDLVARTGGQTRTSLALTEARVENHRTIIYRNGAADLFLSPEDAAKADLRSWRTVVVTGTALAAEPSRGAVSGLMRRAADAGCRIVLDIDYRPYSWESREQAGQVLLKAARASAIIAGNEEEFALLAEGNPAASGSPEAQGEAVARELALRPGVIALYKRGPLGSVTFVHGAEPVMTGVHAATPLKPTGAGDSFLAAFLDALDRGAGIAEAVNAGAAAAAIVVSRPGCAPAMPDRRELEAFLEKSQPR